MSTDSKEWSPEVGDRVRAKVTMVNDLGGDGLGVEHCAHEGDEMIVRSVGSGHTNCIAVSHEHLKDRAFVCLG